MEIEELKHHHRIIDMMLSMHSKLRDDNQRLALIINVILLCSSVILSTLVFIDPTILKFLKIDPQVSKVAVGICSTVVFIISLIELRVDWKEKSERYGQACEILSRLKADCRELLKSNEPPDPQRVEDQCKVCAQTLSTLPKIPDEKFPRLKAYYKAKVELSKFIDLHPSVPVWILRIVLLFHGIKKLFFS
ncbi:MAG: DUF4231 domain-containing protein [Symploca sp. SIO3C6]|uniref:DUF4231 domain-containing protein n=1 Tax=Symploca sp. SIO1C4 TaxID=2607765 RepID=A0A6B3NDL1_9CYAN|nr:DUF4231 domain-containing protein [Symploca sp. SIO3C6]NER29680.1 DUF4231 domain-containing protein [Symploca sp. SIO1C4]NET03492.1 DUF4231 domain-containing protein [Symploca sp. SIO2B6]